ncbi:hypothetical protein JCM8208_002327 [Rhodotorula glutinis]
MPHKASNGYAVPKPQLASGFEWQNVFEELLEQTASTNVVDADWSILKEMIKYKLAEAISNFLAMGPPWPLPPDDAMHARARAYDTLDSFSSPPFTIQRLCELALYPRRQYTSLPKYLRAVSRVLSVTSERTAFDEDDGADHFASTSAVTLDTSLGVIRQGVIHPPAHSLSLSPIATRRPTPSPSSPSPRSSPQVVPLLSPIPWLRKGDSGAPAPSSSSSKAMSENGDVESFHLGSPPPATSPRPPTVSLPSTNAAALASAPNPQSSPPKPLQGQGPATATPTGGLVDEVDPGSGGSETMEPVALSSATTLAPPGEGDAVEGAGGEDTVEKGASLRERFVRASSPRVEAPLDPEASAGSEGAQDEMATGP